MDAPQSSAAARFGLLGALLAVVFLLTGCFAVDVNASVAADGTVSGTAQFGVSKALAEATGGKDALLKQLRGRRPCALGASSSRADYDDGKFVGERCTFDRISFASFNEAFASAPGGGPTLTRVGGQFRLSGRFDLQQVLSSSPLPAPSNSDQVVPSPELGPLPSDSDAPTQLPSDLASLLPSDLARLVPTPLPTDLASLLPSDPRLNDADRLDSKALLRTATVRFSFSFPGSIRSSAGAITGTSVTFAPDAAGRIDFSTVADAARAPSRNSGALMGWRQRLNADRWAVAGGGICAALLAAAAVRRRQLRVRRARRQLRLGQLHRQM